NINAERNIVFLEYRIRPDPVVAVPSVKGQAGETTAEVSFDKPAMHFGERHNLHPCPPDALDNPFKERRRDLQAAIALKSTSAGRAHVLECQDRAHAAEERSQEKGAAAKIQRLKPRPDQGFFHFRTPAD